MAKKSATDLKNNNTTFCDKALEAKINLKKTPHIKPENPNLTIFGFRISEIKWTNVIWLSILHVSAVYGFIHGLLNPVRFYTVLFVSFLSQFSGFGMSVGGHRLWAHRSFKARLPLRIILLILQTATVNGSALSYARDHRTHHKWTDTEPDPKNPSRGFFYAHIGWWLLKKKQIVKDHGKKLSFEDLYSDPLLRFQHKFYIPLAIIIAFVFPTLIPYYLWGENLLTAFLLCGPLRVCVILHHLFTVNSLAHYVGWRPYDKNIWPRENKLVIYLSLGEGNHNYHHTFPWDYSSSEKAWWEFFNPASFFIRFNQFIGLAYDLKKPSQELVQQVVRRKGIPEYFENDRNKILFRRVICGAFDWFLGILISLWSVFTVILFKMVTCRELIIIDSCFKQYIDFLSDYWFCENFLVYY